MRRAPATVLAALLLLLLTGAAPALAAAPAPAQANPSGFLRVGHLAPLVGPVDVALVLPSGDDQIVVEKAAYGAITDYETLEPGRYTLQMRTAGAPADAAPLLSAPVDLDGGSAYTVLATGTPDDLVTSVVDDDLSPPPAGSARVRVLQGSTSASSLTVEAVDGPVLARDVQYGTATGYGDVPEGRWTLRLTGADGAPTAPVVDLAAGTVNSLVVTDSPDGKLQVTPVLDASGIDADVAPVGGVETGGGGTAAGRTGETFNVTAALAAGLGTSAVLVLLATTRRRSAERLAQGSGR